MDLPSKRRPTRTMPGSMKSRGLELQVKPTAISTNGAEQVSARKSDFGRLPMSTTSSISLPKPMFNLLSFAWVRKAQDLPTFTTFPFGTMFRPQPQAFPTLGWNMLFRWETDRLAQPSEAGLCAMTFSSTRKLFGAAIPRMAVQLVKVTSRTSVPFSSRIRVVSSRLPLPMGSPSKTTIASSTSSMVWLA